MNRVTFCFSSCVAIGAILGAGAASIVSRVHVGTPLLVRPNALQTEVVPAEGACWDAESVLKALRAPNVLERQRAEESAQFEYDRLVAGLVEVITAKREQGFDKDLYLRAVELLTGIGASAAIPALVANVDAPVGSPFSTRPDALARYACARSLVTFGDPAADEIVSYLRHTADPIYCGVIVSDRVARAQPISDKAIQLLAYVLSEIDGKDAAIARLEQAPEKRNVIRALELMRRGIVWTDL